MALHVARRTDERHDDTGSEDVRATLGLGRSSRRRRLARWAMVVAGVVVLGVTLSWLRSSNADVAPAYQTETVRRGTLTVAVTATGDLQSLTQVSIGTEISGVVESVAVDFNSAVRVGQVLARVNTDKLAAQESQARAALEAARARQRQTAATLAEEQSELSRLQSVWTSSGGRVPSRNDLDMQDAVVKRADADVASAAAQHAQAEANLVAIATDLKRAVIRSPINGVVLDRQVDPGQTVAASFQTPVLFTLAEDLTRMRLIVDVDEADIGSVSVGQAATFRVDAYPDRRFVSQVTEIRSTPTTSNGVVTYQTVLSVDNTERLLRPGMTATATITVNEVANALLVPNAALRFTPPATTQQAAGGFRLLSTPPPVNAPPRTEGDRPRVWALRGTEAVPVEVTPGPTDGRSTAVTAKELMEGTLVVTDLVTN